MTRTAARMLLLLSAAGLAMAGLAAVPEIDPASGAAALALVSGAMLVLKGRRRK